MPTPSTDSQALEAAALKQLNLVADCLTLFWLKVEDAYCMEAGESPMALFDAQQVMVHGDRVIVAWDSTPEDTTVFERVFIDGELSLRAWQYGESDVEPVSMHASCKAVSAARAEHPELLTWLLNKLITAPMTPAGLAQNAALVDRACAALCQPQEPDSLLAARLGDASGIRDHIEQAGQVGGPGCVGTVLYVPFLADPANLLVVDSRRVVLQTRHGYQVLFSDRE